MTTQPTAKSLALKFVSGKYQGGIYPLRSDREIVIGRGSDLDLVLAEDMVSRKHAKITCQDGVFWIQDLGSTNGTFVNGERVKKGRLAEGDRLLIGSSILKVMIDDRTCEQTDDQIRRGLEEAAASLPRPSGMQGRLEEVPLPDLLQLLATARKTGVLIVKGPEQEARLHFRTGCIARCAIDGNLDLSPKKSFFRLLEWNVGSFELGQTAAADDEPPSPEIAEPLEVLLVEGMRQMDELKRIEADLPPRKANLSLALPLSVPLRALSADELDTIQLVLNHATFQAVLDRASAADAETAERVVSLLKRGYLRVGGA